MRTVAIQAPVREVFSTCTHSAISSKLSAVADVRIPLTQGKYAIIDESDLPIVARFNWHAQRHGRHFYAATNKPNRGKLYMHVLLCDVTEVDHHDGNGLNNRRENLRPCSDSQNQANARRLRTDNTSGFKGVCFFKKKWRALIRVHGKRIYLGGFETPQEAAKAYDQAAVHYFGEFAATNAHILKHPPESV